MLVHDVNTCCNLHSTGLHLKWYELLPTQSKTHPAFQILCFTGELTNTCKYSDRRQIHHKCLYDVMHTKITAL